MRENLFRAKRIDNKKWTEGNLVKSSDADQGFGAIIIPTEKSNMFLRKKENDLGFEVWHPVIPETVCQYTGLTDKNGRKIFEGDILLFDYELGSWGRTAKVLFEDGEYRYKAITSAVDLYNCRICGENDRCEVIGNIFDNPELIGEQGK